MRRWLRAVAALGLLAVPAAATGPALHFVDGVAAGDVLNVRAGPGVGNADIGDLAPDGPGIAVLERDATGGWGHIPWQDGSGWVSMAYLRPAFRDGPELMQVTGVPTGDVLNVRAEPSAEAEIIGSAGSDGAFVEVLGADPEARWGQVIHAEGNGWVALRHLAPANPARVPESPLAVGLSCTGTEPFWAFRITTRDTVRLGAPGDMRQMAIVDAGRAEGRQSFPAFLTADHPGSDGPATLVVRPGSCSDGMSDRLYGWSAELLTPGRLRTGCCGMTAGE